MTLNILDYFDLYNIFVISISSINITGYRNIIDSINTL